MQKLDISGEVELKGREHAVHARFALVLILRSCNKHLLGHCITWHGRMCSGSPRSVQSRPPCCGSGFVQVRFLV